MELGERKQRILSAVIEAYIKTGEPVGSKSVAPLLDHAVSSATVRNEMAELAALGYLEQPHTSAGRIPTAAAFRLYIDKLMPRQGLAQRDRQDIDGRLSRVADDPSRLVGEASEVLAETTGCAAVSTTPSGQETEIRRIDILRVSAHTAAILLMTNSGLLRSRVFRFDREIETDILERLSHALSAVFVGCPVSDVTLPRVQGLVASLGDDGLICIPALTSFHRLVKESAEAEILLSGQINLLSHPDYAPERVRALLSFLAQREMVSGMLTAIPSGLSVLIGDESRRPELDGTSIIVTRYRADGDMGGGHIGIIGPLRMDYAAAIPRLEYFAKVISRTLRELMGPTEI